jgi:alkylation response protein AidB-like acyl-CoA dehydrogenase
MINQSTAKNYYIDDGRIQGRLRRLLKPDVLDWAEPMLIEMGRLAADFFDPRAVTADRCQPVLRSFDRDGNRVDAIDYHPAYQEMARCAYEFGLVSMRYDRTLREQRGYVPSVLLFGLGYLLTQAETGLYCPVCMTDGAARVLLKFASPELRARYLPRLAARDFKSLYQGAMFLTEKQGGSDVGSNTTMAADKGDHWELQGDKWFCSNVDADVILALARPEGAEEGTKGLGMFLVPKTLPDGSRNRFRINRLKDKLGVRSMPTGEVTFEGAVAYVVGDVGEGFAYMTEMLNLSRLYNSVASIGIMRRAVLEAVSHAHNREAFGRRVIDFPLMQRVLADMIVEHEAATALVFEAVRQLDIADSTGGDPVAERRLRMLTPLTKYHTGRLAVQIASEALEVLGGNGYIEEFVTCRLLRDAQVLPIWEGTTSILILDAVRAMTKEKGHTALMDANATRFQSVTVAELLNSRAMAEGRVSELLARMALLLRGGVETTFAAKDVTDELIQITQASLLLADAQENPSLRPLARYFIDKHFRGKTDSATAAQIIATECESLRLSDER